MEAMRAPKRAVFAVMFLAAVLGHGTARAQEKEIQDELKKLLGDVRQSLVDELSKALGSRDERIANAIGKMVEERIQARVSRLEQALKERDAKIADLEARLKGAPAAAPAGTAAAAPSSAFLGVAHTDVPADLRQRLKIEKGALVTRVMEGTPAAAAGIQTGDVIVSLNGTDATSETLEQLVRTFKPDQEVNVAFFRDGTKTTKAAKLADKTKFDTAAGKPRAEEKKEPAKLGLEIEEREGAIHVIDVEAGMTAAIAGVEKGDKLLQLNGKDVKSIEDVQNELKKVLDGDKLIVQFVRSSDKEDVTYTATLNAAKGKDTAKLVARDEKKVEKKVEKKKGVLGIAVVPDAQGILVQDVEPDTAAAAFGIQKGDVVKKVGGQDIADIEALRGVLSKLSAGDKVTIHVSRGGQTVEVKDIVLGAEGEKVPPRTVAAAPKEAEKPKDAPRPEAEKPKEAEKPAQETKKPGILRFTAIDDVGSGKVLVTDVTRGGPAEKAGLLKGDVVVRLNDKPVRNTDELAVMLQALFAGDTITLRVARGGEEKDLKATLVAREDASKP
jgi:S1-C subfamily serine protease